MAAAAAAAAGQPASEPVDLLVGPGTPVRVHVTRRPLSGVQALTESLYHASKSVQQQARTHLKSAGEAYLREQADQRSVAAAAAGSSRSGSQPHQQAAAARRSHQHGVDQRNALLQQNQQSQHSQQNQQPVRSQSASAASASAGRPGSDAAGDQERPPFYPPPNKTHQEGGSTATSTGLSSRPAKSLRQGARVDFALGTAEAPSSKFDVATMDRRDDLEAEVQHYRRRVEELQETVDDLRDELEVQRSNRELAQSAEQIEAVRTDAVNGARGDRAVERGTREAATDTAESRSELLAQLKEFEETNRTLRKMLRSLNEQSSGRRFEVQREALLSQIDELEKSNRKLREQLYKRDAENEVLNGKAMHSEELQRSFENMKKAMRDNQAKLERQLKAKRRECLQKDEEIARLLQQHSSTALSMGEFRDAVSELEAKAAGEKAALKQAYKETKHRLRHCESVLDQLRADLAHRESRVRAGDEEVQQLRDSQASLQQRLARLTEAHEAALGEVDQRDARVADLQSQNQRLQTELQKSTERVQSLVTELDAKVSDLNQTRSDMHALQLQHRELVRRSEDQANEARRATEKASQLSQQIDKLETKLRAEKELAESARRELSSSVGILQQSLSEERRQNDEARRRAEDRVLQLEGDLRRAVEAAENVEKVRREEERRAQAELSSLREKLDYANTAKRSLENYVSYIKSTYNSVFEDPRLV